MTTRLGSSIRYVRLVRKIGPAVLGSPLVAQRLGPGLPVAAHLALDELSPNDNPEALVRLSGWQELQGQSSAGLLTDRRDPHAEALEAVDARRLCYAVLVGERFGDGFLDATSFQRVQAARQLQADIRGARCRVLGPARRELSVGLSMSTSQRRMSWMMSRFSLGGAERRSCWSRASPPGAPAIRRRSAGIDWHGVTSRDSYVDVGEDQTGELVGVPSLCSRFLIAGPILAASAVNASATRGSST
jgi:hypothetical protein